MLKTSKLVLAAMVFAGGLAGNAQAAEPLVQLDEISGKVLVDYGKGFSQPLRNSHLHVGDRVFVGQDASVVLSYEANNCSVRYDKPAVLVIKADAVCKPGENRTAAQTTFVIPAADVVGQPGMVAPGAMAAGGVFPVFIGVSVEAAALIIAGSSFLADKPVSAP